MRLAVMTESVWAVIICYFPSRHEVMRLLDALSGQVQKTLVMNNGGIEIQLLKELSVNPAVTVVDLGGNMGIGAALNSAFRLMLLHNVAYGVTFDQDSQPPPLHVITLLAARKRLALKGGSSRWLGAIGPSFYDAREGRFDYPFFRASGWLVRRVNRNTGEAVPKVDALITSGMLVPVALWHLHPFLEHLFIEHVDTEWCFRTLNEGYQHHGCFDVQMCHELSDGQPIIFAGVIFLRYSALRRYYYFRNTAFLIGRRYVPAAFRLRLALGFIVKALVSPLIDTSARKTLLATIAGLTDGVRGRFGQKD